MTGDISCRPSASPSSVASPDSSTMSPRPSFATATEAVPETSPPSRLAPRPSSPSAPAPRASQPSTTTSTTTSSTRAQPTDQSSEQTGSKSSQSSVGIEDLDAAIQKLAEPEPAPAAAKVSSGLGKKPAVPSGRDRNIRRPDSIDNLFRVDPTERVTKVLPPAKKVAPPPPSSKSGINKAASKAPELGHSTARKQKDGSMPLSQALSKMSSQEEAQEQRDKVEKPPSSSKSKLAHRAASVKPDLDVDELSERFLTKLLLEEKSSPFVDIGGFELRSFDSSLDRWTNRAHSDQR